MFATILDSKSVWLEHSRPRFASLKEDGRFDVVVVGGGITGLTAAYLLKRAGKTVAVLEQGRIGGAETGHTTAHLTQVTDARLHELVSQFGDDGAREAWRAGAAAIDVIEGIAAEHQIACRFQRVPGFLHARIAEETDERTDLQRETDLAYRLGLAAEYVSVCPAFGRPAVRYPNQALFHPIDYLAGLARAVHGDGCAIFENSKAEEFTDHPSVTARGKRIETDRIVIATHVPLMGTAGLVDATLLQTKLAGYSTYALGAKVPDASLAAASYWDTADPYYYTRIERRGNHAYVVFGGEDHKTGIDAEESEARYARLEELLRRYFPAAEVDHRWSGQVIEPADGLPYIGAMSEQQFVATGFSGNGLTFGTLAGMLACDWVLGRANPWSELFSVDRKPLSGALWDYVTENLSYPYHLVKGWLTPSGRQTLDSIPSGEGRILRIDGRQCAASRSREGELQVCSAICTHMGCIVRWNTAEQSWDCPCHGSRFTADGGVMAGPAETPLERLDPATLMREGH
jgi:glycine/D-amino acid oxidase-like deaminating enzyme/nitrite reductase/ring-hydroxylating ferredoxin subunit